jgi:hypothetical protein
MIHYCALPDKSIGEPARVTDTRRSRQTFDS